MQVGEAAADDVEHVADGRAGGRGHDADHPRERGEGSLARLLEEPFRLQLALELLEGELERTQPLRLHHLDHELVLTPRRVHVEAAEGQHLHAVFQLEAHAAAPSPEQHGGDLGAFVLEGEVRVAGAGVRRFEISPPPTSWESPLRASS